MADGVYPRINGAMALSGQYTGQLVSLVGKVVHDSNSNALVLECCGDGRIALNVQSMEDPTVVTDAATRGVVVELIGQVMTEPQMEFMAFVCRDLGSDMDMNIYNQMIQIQQHSKYAHYFAPSSSGKMAVTN